MKTFWRSRRISLPNPERRSRHGKVQSKQGVTLIEVAFGILILAVTAVAVIAALRHPRYMAVSSIHRQGATHIANEVLEMAVATGYNSLTNGTDTVTELVNNYDLHGRDVTITREISAAPGSLDGKLIEVEVTYPGGDAPVRVATFVMRGST